MKKFIYLIALMLITISIFSIPAKADFSWNPELIYATQYTNYSYVDISLNDTCNYYIEIESGSFESIREFEICFSLPKPVYFNPVITVNQYRNTTFLTSDFTFSQINYTTNSTHATYYYTITPVAPPHIFLSYQYMKYNITVSYYYDWFPLSFWNGYIVRNIYFNGTTEQIIIPDEDETPLFTIDFMGWFGITAGILFMFSPGLAYLHYRRNGDILYAILILVIMLVLFGVLTLVFVDFI